MAQATGSIARESAVQGVKPLRQPIPQPSQARTVCSNSRGFSA